MKKEEAIKAIKDNYPPSRYSMLREALDMSIEALEKAEKYKWHDLRKNPDDLPDVKGFGYVPCFIIKEYSSVPEYCEYEFFEGYGWGFFGCDFKSIIAWREIEPFVECEDEQCT